MSHTSTHKATLQDQTLKWWQVVSLASYMRIRMQNIYGSFCHPVCPTDQGWNFIILEARPFGLHFFFFFKGHQGHMTGHKGH